MTPAASNLRLVTPDLSAPGPARAPATQPMFSARSRQRAQGAGRKPLGQILIDMKAVAPDNMLKALMLREREEARIGDILLTHGWVSEADLMATLALQWGARVVDLMGEPPDTRLIDRLGPEFCLAHGLVPWRRIGGATVVVTARPEEFATARAALPDGFGPVVMALALEGAIHASLIATRQTTLIRKAEARVDLSESCRGLDGRRAPAIAAGFLLTLGLGLLALPALTFALLTGWALITLVAFSALKLVGFATEVRARARMARAARTDPALSTHKTPARLPVVSVMVPLFREDDIAPRLIRRIGRINYPKELLDVLLVVEEDDPATQAALSRRPLPRWMRVVIVPRGPIRTKPRALNYALDFCRGSIIGIWDAEDAPDPGQIHEVVRRFTDAPPEVVCLQGILDFYNARHNWITRCFTVEYAAWFRAVLPGIARLGLVVPLGGTTLFFRRSVLEELGGWDAHNVTEDADLGLRLARHGYRTELIDTVTREEPNSRPAAWIRQRSRWQKGFAMTWASHMRDPAQLWRDLGPKRFLSVQILLLCSVSQSLLAPLLWTFWLLSLGLPHPLSGVLPGWVLAVFAGLFLSAEAINITVGLWATRGPEHRHLMKWVPTLHFYFPLAALSAWKALKECVTQPFYWDKTAHGVVATGPEPNELLPVLVLSNPVHVPANLPDGLVKNPATRMAPRRRLHLSAQLRLHEEPIDALVARSVFTAIRNQNDPVEYETTGARPRNRYILGSTIAAAAARGPGIEFQTSFEGF